MQALSQLSYTPTRVEPETDPLGAPKREPPSVRNDPAAQGLEPE
jgi:hypothetical protein